CLGGGLARRRRRECAGGVSCRPPSRVVRLPRLPTLSRALVVGDDVPPFGRVSSRRTGQRLAPDGSSRLDLPFASHRNGPANHQGQGHGGPPKPLLKEEAGHNVRGALSPVVSAAWSRLRVDNGSCSGVSHAEIGRSSMFTRLVRIARFRSSPGAGTLTAFE